MPTCEDRHIALGGSLKTIHKKFKLLKDADF
jgi:hypothetical protein